PHRRLDRDGVRSPHHRRRRQVARDGRSPRVGHRVRPRRAAAAARGVPGRGCGAVVGEPRVLPRACRPGGRGRRRAHGDPSGRSALGDLRAAPDHLHGGRSRAAGGAGGQPGERRDVLHRIARRQSRERSARHGAADRGSDSFRALSQRARHRRTALSRDGPPIGLRRRGPVRSAAGALRRRLQGADAPRSRAHDLGRARTPRVRPVRPGAGRHVPPGTGGGIDARKRGRRMTVRIGLLGCGNISDTHARAAALVPDVEVVAYWGRDPAKASALAQRYGGKGYRTLDEFLGHRPMDLVVVGTPSGVHAEHAQAAARQGLHVLVEKPLDVTTAGIDGLTAECDRAAVKLGVIYQDRAAPDLVWLRQLIAGGGLGRPIVASARMRWYRPPEYYAGSRWRGTWGLDGGGALMNQGIHTVDLLVWLLGDVDRVYAATRTALHDIAVEDTAVASLEFAGGAVGTLEATIAAIRTGATPLCDGRDGRKSVALVEAMYRSARTGTAVVLDEPEGVLDALER